MASELLLMPKLGLTMTEGVLVEWKVAPGDRFAKGDILFVVETDKTANDVAAETEGTVAERLAAEGDTVPVGGTLARLAGNDNAAPPVPERIIATPLARRIARERMIDLAGVTGSGPRGRIKACDVERISVKTEVPPPGSEAPPPPVQSANRSKPSSLQAAMARRLAAVKQGVPHFYLATEVEVSALLRLRADLNADAQSPKLTLTHFLLAAVGRALKAQANINRVWDDSDIITFPTTGVSLAVETEAGLLVPVVPDCGTTSLDEVARSARDAIARAHDRRLTPADMNGAALAISNAGMHDVTWLTSIINPGQSAILGVGSVRDVFRPDGEGRPSLRREMGLVFSGDHRVHTGVEGLAFLNAVKAHLERPFRLLRHS